MKIPVIRGIIERRILVNFRVDPDALKRVLPEPFRPKLIGDVGMAGICLIRLKHIRPRFLPAFVGISSENAAHRIAVQWESGGRTQEGVYVLRRDTSSRLNSAAGGRLFPGIHHHARFDVQEQDDRYCRHHGQRRRGNALDRRGAVSDRVAGYLDLPFAGRGFRVLQAWFTGLLASLEAGHFRRD